MTDATPRSYTLEVPGARLYFEIRGSGPPLFLIGAPLHSKGFAAIAPLLADRHTVVTYDPRGIARSVVENPDADVTPDTLADDVHHLIQHLGAVPADVFGSSGGATTGLALVTRHPGSVRTLVAHEPPVMALLPDRDRLLATMEDIYQTYRTEGPRPAMGKFLTVTGVRSPSEPTRSGGGPARGADRSDAGASAISERFLGHMLRPISSYRPDLDALRTTSTHIVVAGGTTSRGQLAHRTAMALAEQLGTRLMDFPGDHSGFAGEPEAFAEVLQSVLDSGAS